MTTRVLFRDPTKIKNLQEHERIEKIHDWQDTLLSKDELNQCNNLRLTYNEMVKRRGKSEFVVEVPIEVTDNALLCFMYATKRTGEKPVMTDEKDKVYFK